jgi:hypothetical protein
MAKVGKTSAVTRREFRSALARVKKNDAAIEALHETVDQLRRESNVQFERIARVQADLDLIQAAWRRVKPES